MELNDDNHFHLSSAPDSWGMLAVASRSHGVQLLGGSREASPQMLLGQKFLGASFCLRGH